MSELQLFIRREDGSVAAVAVPADGTVATLRKAAAAAAGVADERTVRLCFGGAEMRDGRAALADVGLSMQATVDVQQASAAQTVLSVGVCHALAILEDGSVAAWGVEAGGRCDVPDFGGLRAVSVAAAEVHSLALLEDGSIAAWGSNMAGQISLPPELAAKRAVRIAATAFGQSFDTCGFNVSAFDDGTVATWGDFDRFEFRTDAAAKPPLLACCKGDAAVVHDGQLRLLGRHKRCIEVGAVRCLATTAFDVLLVGADGAVCTRSTPEFHECRSAGDRPVVAASGSGSGFSLLLLADGGVEVRGPNDFADDLSAAVGASAIAVAAGRDTAFVLLQDGSIVTGGRRMPVPDFGGRRVMRPSL